MDDWYNYSKQAARMFSVRKSLSYEDRVTTSVVCPGCNKTIRFESLPGHVKSKVHQKGEAKIAKEAGITWTADISPGLTQWNKHLEQEGWHRFGLTRGIYI
jgi:hypothetical protein